MKEKKINSDVGEIVSILLSTGVLREKDVLYAQRLQEKLSSP